ncbi:MAG: hypothetical protein Ct9H300mP11_24240 [Chloroflexota bacterium]|nr:MAG: hypothetical protein Ct9H300mP11_24240 [Chloroflexota bacterium]
MGSAIVSTPVLVPNGLVVAAKDGNLLLLDTKQKPRTKASAVQSEDRDADIKAPLFAVGDPVYVGSQDKTVRRIDFKGGQRNVWCLAHSRRGRMPQLKKISAERTRL